MKIKSRLRAGERKSIARFREAFAGPRLLTGLMYNFASLLLPAVILASFGLFAVHASGSSNHHGILLAAAAVPAVVGRSNINGLKQKKIDLVKANRAFLDKARAEERDLNQTEAKDYADNIEKIKALEVQIERETELLEMERGMEPVVDENSRAAGTHQDAPKFETLGEFLVAVVRASKGNGRNIDQRLLAAASGGSEAVPSDGGFLVQKDFSTELLQRTYELGAVSQRVRRIPISSNANGVKVNAIDEDSRADGSRWGGVQAFWANEADAFTASKPKFRQIEVQLQKLIGLCYATDELLQDAAALEAVIMQTFPLEMTFKVEDAIINGTGSGQPLGILNSGAVVTVTKDSGDSGATISTADVLQMWSRMWARSRQNAVWLINQDVEPKLYPLALGSGTSAILLYTPPGAVAAQYGGQDNAGGRYGLLMGRPVIPVEYCATLGTPGDIILCDLGEYLMADKGAPQAASSIHVRFLNDETTFRFVYRVDGQPTWKKPLTPKNGTATKSPFISLSTRS